MYQELELWKAEQANKPKETLVLTSKQAEFLMTYHGASSLTELSQMRGYNVIIKPSVFRSSDDLLSAALAECFAMNV